FLRRLLARGRLRERGGSGCVQIKTTYLSPWMFVQDRLGIGFARTPCDWFRDIRHGYGPRHRLRARGARVVATCSPVSIHIVELFVRAVFISVATESNRRALIHGEQRFTLIHCFPLS